MLSMGQNRICKESLKERDDVGAMRPHLYRMETKQHLKNDQVPLLTLYLCCNNLGFSCSACWEEHVHLASSWHQYVVQKQGCANMHPAAGCLL